MRVHPAMMRAFVPFKYVGPLDGTDGFILSIIILFYSFIFSNDVPVVRETPTNSRRHDARVNRCCNSSRHIALSCFLFGTIIDDTYIICHCYIAIDPVRVPAALSRACFAIVFEEVVVVVP